MSKQYKITIEEIYLDEKPANDDLYTSSVPAHLPVEDAAECSPGPNCFYCPDRLWCEIYLSNKKSRV